MTDPHTSPAEPAAVDRLGADMIKRLQTLNEAILWKLDGLTEYDLRRPLTPTGTNLLGVVKWPNRCWCTRCCGGIVQRAGE
ncbi:mycothiol transferase [Nostocoides jenkinsii]|jgi:hypothetical protein|uniref:Uncharacterized protein n=1 Tax=Nostocoides jenkinsii Ben 74 TaxID=1193518 RepID=A0A077MA89_9MICO|nr:DUF664 domain-containing protein [Tetrasphaera jenkinsii]CCI53534.1 hypothetical protein BN13_410010 [Tetrasphaera jenkinsii Ben 74]